MILINSLSILFLYYYNFYKTYTFRMAFEEAQGIYYVMKFISNQEMNFLFAILSRGGKFYFVKYFMLLSYPSMYPPGFLLQSTKVRSKIVYLTSKGEK